MKQFRCLIADDEPIARQILENYIEEIPNLELVASCKNAFEFMAIAQEQHIDLWILDINMPKLSGLALLKMMQQKPEVIITTAYPEFAVEGFKLSVTDYLLKPFSLERFLQAFLKVQNNLKNNSKVVPVHKEIDIKSIFVKSDKKIIKVVTNSINHIEAFGNYIKIFTDTMILTPQTLSLFLKKLPDNFVRVHKSHVINFNSVKLIEGNQIELLNGTVLPIGKSYKKHILEKTELG
jgi:DNA-binding LytR/AlgR family response regulator